MADVTFTAADIRPLPGSNVKPIKAGGALTVGHAFYIDSSAKAEGADADVSLQSMALGIVVSAPNGKTSAVDGDMVDVACVGSLVTGFSGLTPGTPMYASITTGRISDTRPAAASGDFAWVIGFAWNATTILVNPFTDIFSAL